MSQAPIRVIVAGATGAVGKRLVPAIMDDPGFELVGAVGRSGVGVDVGTLHGRDAVGVRLVADIDEALADSECDALVDYTAPDAAVRHCLAALAASAAVFIGTTGLGARDIEVISMAAEAQGVGAFLAPNMTVSGQLMFRCAEFLRPFFGDVEIIETHQLSKLDAPLGPRSRPQSGCRRSRSDRRYWIRRVSACLERGGRRWVASAFTASVRLTFMIGRRSDWAGSVD